MHKVVINGVDLSEEFIISESQYPIYSKSNIYIDRTENTPYFSKITDESKPVTLVFNKKDQCMGSIELQHYMEKFVATKLKTKEPTWIEVDGRYMFAMLDAISDSDMYQGKVIATFMNLPGKWYSEEKTTTSLSIINNGVDETWCVEFEIMPTTNQVVLKNSLGKVITVEASSTTTPVYINMMDKTVKQSARHAPMNPNSRLFPLVKGANNLVITGGTATIKYREVIAL